MKKAPRRCPLPLETRTWPEEQLPPRLLFFLGYLGYGLRAPPSPRRHGLPLASPHPRLPACGLRIPFFPIQVCPRTFGTELMASMHGHGRELSRPLRRLSSTGRTCGHARPQPSIAASRPLLLRRGSLATTVEKRLLKHVDM